MKMTTERDEALAKLRAWIWPGDTVCTIIRHVSRSGMQRAISPVIATDDGPMDISYWVARALGYRVHRNHGGLVVSGAGMDMGFAVVYELARALWEDGFDCLGADCLANDHSNPPYPERGMGSMHHADGGYALRQRWL